MRCAGRKDVKLLSVKIDSKALSGSDYELTPESLTISSPPSGTFQVPRKVEGGMCAQLLYAYCGEGAAVRQC